MPPRPFVGVIPGIGDVLGLISMPGIGAIVAAGAGDGLGLCVVTGAGVGANVFVGIPGIGVIVGSAAAAGTALAATNAATRTKRGKGNEDLDGLNILRTVVHHTRTHGFEPSGLLTRRRPGLAVVGKQVRQIVPKCGMAERKRNHEAGNGQRRNPDEPAVLRPTCNCLEPEPSVGAQVRSASDSAD